jgi:hypothetical protein
MAEGGDNHFSAVWQVLVSSLRTFIDVVRIIVWQGNKKASFT